MPIKLAKKFQDKTNLASPTKVYKGLKTSNWGKREWMRLAVFLVVSGALGYVTFSTFAATVDNTAHPDGSLVTFSGGHVYLIEGGLRRPVTSEDALYTNGYNFDMVVPATQADQALQPGPPLGLRAGQLITTPGAGVWDVVDSGNGNYTKWGVANETAFYNLHYSYNQVKSVPANELPPDSPNYVDGTNHAGGQFIQGTDGIVYMIGNSGKYRVADPSVLATYPFPVYAAVPGDMALPTLGFLPYHEGSLVSSPGSGKVYMMGCGDTSGAQGFCNMQKHWITDPATLTNLNYSFSQVKGGVDGNLDTITTGAPVTATPNPPPCLPNNSQCNPTPPTPPVVAPDAPTTPGAPPAPPASSAGTAPSGAITSLSATYPYTALASGSVVSGWAADKESVIKNVQIYVDGNLKGSVTGIRQLTSGVCSATDSRPGCPNVGWQWQLDTTGLAVGTHTIHFVAIDNDLPTSHTWQSPDSYFNFGNTNPNTQPPPPPPAPVNPAPPSPTSPSNPGTAPTGWLDAPDDSKSPPVLVNGSSISGWAVDKETLINGVQVYIDGNLAKNVASGNNNATLKIPDPAVCTGTKANWPGCPNVGWQWTLDATGLKPGTHTVHFIATDKDSPTPHTYKSLDHNFTIANPTSPGTVLNNPPPAPPTTPTCLPNTVPVCTPGLPPSGVIATPATGTKVKGLQPITGWAFDNLTKPESAIYSVAVSVNGSFVGYAKYGLVQDSDDGVRCHNHGNPPGCPGIGWQFNLDTTGYSYGTPLNVKVTITDSDWAPNTTTLGATYYSANGTQCLPSSSFCIPGLPIPTQPTKPPTTPGTGATQLYKVVYAYPSEVKPDQTEIGRIPADISNFQTWLKDQTSGTHAIPLAPKGIQLSISSSVQQIKLPKTTQQYITAAQNGSGWSPSNPVNVVKPLVDQINADLNLNTANNQKYLVYIDGNFPNTNCGIGGGPFANWLIHATQWQESSAPTPVEKCEDITGGEYIGGPIYSSYFQDLGPLHEIFHSFGVVPACAPHLDTTEEGYTKGDKLGHVLDPDDVMHYLTTGPTEVLDPHHTDYYSQNPTCPGGLTDPSAWSYFNRI